MNYKYKYTYLVIPTEGKKFFGKVYFGQHVTNDLNDGYICSSSLISKWCKKHPNGYYREIIAFYDTQEELNEAEYNLIHPHLNKPYCLNLRDGGNYGNMSEDARKRQSKQEKGRHLSNEWKKHISESLKGKYKGKNNHLYGKHLSEKTRKKISESLKGKYKGKKHPMYGKHQSEEHKQKIRKNSNRGKHRVYDNTEHTKWHYEK